MSKFIVLLTFLHAGLDADLNKQLNTFFNSFGSAVNVNSANVYNGQKAGYATGGSMCVRNRVLNSKMATINMPKIDAGCGGIDIYAGGFSFINNERLVETLKSIASSSVGYAFFLGIETVSPQIANQMRTLQSMANMMNGVGINSCEIATQAVGSVWPQNAVASQHICRSVGTQTGLNNDYIQSRHQCNTSVDDNKIVSRVNKEHPNLLYGDYNLAWKAIQQQGFLTSQKNLAELFMTITGTIVSFGEKELVFPSKITNESFLRVLLEGGTASIYRCDNPKQCLVVTEEELTILPEDAWVGKIQATLLEIQNKVLFDEELTAAEISFLGSSNLPLYKIISVLTSYKHGISPIDLINISDIVAMDMLMQSLKESLEVIRTGCQQLKMQQMFAGKIDDFMANLSRVEKEIKYYESKAFRRFEQEMQLMKKIQIIEDQIALELNF